LVKETLSTFVLNKALLIDDDKIYSEIVKIMNENQRLIKELKIINFPEKALNFLFNCEDSELPELIFMDINMPIYNAWHLLDIFKENERTKNIPVIILTSSIQNFEKDKAMKYQQVRQFISKPLDFNKLPEILEVATL
jgi:CheY-like chemotaxis protein